MVSIASVAWLAGLLEGEGCFGYQANGGTTIALNMTDRDVIERAATLLGAWHIQHRKIFAPARKQPYGIVVSGAAARGWMMTLYTFMGERRKAKIKEVLTAWRTRVRKIPDYDSLPKKTHCMHGHEFTPENTYTYKGSRNGRTSRHCRTCKAEECRRKNARRSLRAQQSRGVTGQQSPLSF